VLPLPAPHSQFRRKASSRARGASDPAESWARRGARRARPASRFSILSSADRCAPGGAPAAVGRSTSARARCRRACRRRPASRAPCGTRRGSCRRGPRSTDGRGPSRSRRWFSAPCVFRAIRSPVPREADHLVRARQRPCRKQALEHCFDFGLHRRGCEVQHAQVFDVGASPAVLREQRVVRLAKYQRRESSSRYRYCAKAQGFCTRLQMMCR